MSKLREHETISRDGPECPACGFQFTPDEGIYYDENRYTHDQCCEANFDVEVHVSYTWICKIPLPEQT
jgi:hypothetical protein